MDQKKLDELRDYYDNTDTSAEIADAELDDEIVQAPMVGITVRLPAAVLQQVRELASREGMKTTALIRRWIERDVAMTSRANSLMPVAGQAGMMLIATHYLGLHTGMDSAEMTRLSMRLKESVGA